MVPGDNPAGRCAGRSIGRFLQGAANGSAGRGPGSAEALEIHAGGAGSARGNRRGDPCPLRAGGRGGGRAGCAGAERTGIRVPGAWNPMALGAIVPMRRRCRVPFSGYAPGRGNRRGRRKRPAGLAHRPHHPLWSRHPGGRHRGGGPGPGNAPGTPPGIPAA